MRRSWHYVVVAVASMAWAFILLALCLALFDPMSAIHGDPVVAAIVIFLALGHLACGRYLLRGIHDDLRHVNSQRSAASRGGSDDKDRGRHSPS